MSFDFWTLAEKRPRVIETAKKHLMQLDLPKRQGSFVSHSFDDLKETFATFAADPCHGVHILRAKPDMRVAIQSSLTKETVLDPEAVYVLVGGLGGIGRSITELFIAKGAKNFAFLSRSGGNAEGKAFLDQLAHKGVTAHSFSVDISDAEKLKSIIEEIKAAQLPIKGVVQCAAVLHVSVRARVALQAFFA